MMVLSRIDAWGKGAWLALVFVASWIAWPIGLALMAFLAGSGRLQAWAPQAWAESARLDRGEWWKPRAAEMRSSGNRAFDEYRQGELRRLEEEQREFTAFLERLRRARDKEEFDRFMAENRASAGGQGGPKEAGQ